MPRFRQRHVVGPLAVALLAVASSVGAQELAPLPPPPPPASAVPPAPAPARPIPIPTGRTDEVRFEPDEPGLILMMRSGQVPVRRLQRFRRVWYYERGLAPAYAPVCDGPCVTPLMPGEYHFAISKDGGRPIPAGSVVLDGPATIHGSYTDRSGLRLAGAVLGIAGAVGGIVMVVLSVGSENVCDNAGYCFSRGTVNGPLLVGGIGVIIGSAIVGSILALQRDEARLAIAPLTLPQVGGAKESPMTWLAAQSRPQGAALTIHF